MRRVGLRSVVAALVLAIVAPLGVVAGLSLQRTWRRQLENLDRQNIATARAISVAVDREIESTASALSVLGELHALDSPDLPAFESLATRFLQYRSNWAAIVLADIDGRVLDGVPSSAGADALAGSTHWARAAVATKGTTVSNLFGLPGEAGRFLMIAVPVVREGTVTRVLGARVKTEGLLATLVQQQAPPNGAVAVIGSNDRIIVRSQGNEEWVDEPVSAELARISAQAIEGSWRGVARDGSRTYAAFSRSARTGLMVALGMPAEVIDGPIRRIVWIFAAVWFFLLGTGAGLGLLLGGVIVRAVNDASRVSMALARGDTIAHRPSRIAELDDLSVGLQQAASAVRTHNRDRDEASRLKDEFLMTVSHELRTPLTAILGWTRMLSTGQIRENQRGRAMEAIDRNASALHQLVNDLLDVSRIVSGRLRLDVQPVVLSDVVASAVDTVRPAADAKSIEIVTRVDLNAAGVSGDPGRLQQVVWNLLSNAVRFTPNGGRIDVGVRQSGNDVEISVCDSGTGVKPEFLPHVFERFRQGEAGTTRAHGGLGLGLAIVRHLVELHGGTVRAENNTASAGATFVIRLPARPSAAAIRGERVVAAAKRDSAPAPARLDGLTFLVVDDDPHARELLTAILENAGATVKAAASVADAVVILEHWMPDALLSDIEMPNEDGYDLLRKVRAGQSAAAKLVAIAVTAHARPNDRRKALDAGFQWHLAKPIDPDELVSVVSTLVAQTAGVA
jgi:signal transduction histidine kinase/ActR/RegA family two-component response regulator